MKCLLVLLLVALSEACPEFCYCCGWHKVNTVDVDFDNLSGDRTLITMAVTKSYAENLDCVTQNIKKINTTGHALIEMRNYYTDGRAVKERAYLQTKIAPGTFYAVGPSGCRIDSILDRTCNNTMFIVYRYHKMTENCVRGVQDVDVFIAFTDPCVRKELIYQGIKIAQMTFPCIHFVLLPCKTCMTCRCC